MLKEHDRIVLIQDLPKEGLKAGGVGTIVHVHRHGEAFEVEFLNVEGDTAAIATVQATQVRPASDREISSEITESLGGLPCHRAS